MRGAGKMSSAARVAAPALDPAAPDLRVRGLAPPGSPPRSSRRLAGLSTLPAPTSQRFPPDGSLSASLSLTREPRLPSKGASGRSSVTANAAPGATGNLLPRRIQCPATGKDEGGTGSAAPFASRVQLVPNRCSQRPAGGHLPARSKGDLRLCLIFGTLVSAVKKQRQ